MAAKNVVVEKFGVVFTEAGHDFTMDVASGQQPATFVMKEGSEYRMKLQFKIEREIVSGLRMFTQITRKGVTTEKMSYMVGSYGPMQNSPFFEFIGDAEEAPKGMIARGHYVAKSKFVDDDQNIHAQWEWTFDVKRAWN